METLGGLVEFMKYAVQEETAGFTAYALLYPTVKFTASTEFEALDGVKTLLAVTDLTNL